MREEAKEIIRKRKETKGMRSKRQKKGNRRKGRP
jgi:hypothetical protein